MKTTFLCALVLVFFGACNSLRYTTTSTPALPEPGTIGVFKDYAFQQRYEGKSVVTLENPIRLQFREITIAERAIFRKTKEATTKKDSVLVSLEILDKIGLAQQINTNKIGLSFLKKAEDCQIVTGVTIYYPKQLLETLRTADELYLIQKKEKTLSIELRKENKVITILEFSQGTIINVQTSAFCWGQNIRKEIVIFDLIPPNATCNSQTYKTARKAKKKHEFNFFK